MSVTEVEYQQNLTDLAGLIESLPVLWRASSEAAASKRPERNAWSAKEIVGHLIDSAQVNLQRFVRGQIEPDFHMVYPQDDCVRFNHYQDRTWTDLITLWVELNRQVQHVAGRVPADKIDTPCGSGPADEDWTIGFRVVDYVAHIRRHLPQIERAVAAP